MTVVEYRMEIHERIAVVLKRELTVEQCVGGDAAVAYKPVVVRSVGRNHLSAGALELLDILGHVDVGDVFECVAAHLDKRAGLVAILLELVAGNGRGKLYGGVATGYLVIVGNERHKVGVARGEREHSAAGIERVEIPSEVGVLERRAGH